MKKDNKKSTSKVNSKKKTTSATKKTSAVKKTTTKKASTKKKVNDVNLASKNVSTKVSEKKKSSFAVMLVVVAVLVILGIVFTIKNKPNNTAVAIISDQIEENANMTLDDIIEKVGYELTPSLNAENEEWTLENNKVVRVEYNVTNDKKTMDIVLRCGKNASDEDDIFSDDTYSKKLVPMDVLCDDEMTIHVDGYQINIDDSIYMKSIWVDNGRNYFMVTQNAISPEDFLAETYNVAVNNHNN